jgi:hypothetical protein
MIPAAIFGAGVGLIVFLAYCGADWLRDRP